jgi:hypothetical protein
MFKRRLYFLFPDVEHVRKGFNDLAGLGLRPAHMHVVARPEIDLEGLPPATKPQRTDRLVHIEKGAWYGNLGLFFLALFGLLVAVATGAPLWAGIMLAVMIVTLITGVWVAMRMPNTRVDEFHQAVEHGEILLLVDATLDCVDEIEALMEVRHPEAIVGGNNWLPALPGV